MPGVYGLVRKGFAAGRPHRAVAVKRRSGAASLRYAPSGDRAVTMGWFAAMAFDGADRPLCGRFCPSKAMVEKRRRRAEGSTLPKEPPKAARRLRRGVDAEHGSGFTRKIHSDVIKIGI